MGDPSLFSRTIVIALFLSIMHLRHPNEFKSCEHIHRKMVEWFKSFPKDYLGRPAVDSIVIGGRPYKIDSSDWEKYENWVKNDHHIFFTDAIKSQATRLAEIMCKKRWSVIFSNDPVFITSDKPLSKCHESKEVFGFNTEGTIINFPLSPTRLLVMDDKHTEPAGRYYPLNDNNAGPINLLTWCSSEKFMISHRNTDEILSEIVGWADEFERNNV